MLLVRYDIHTRSAQPSKRLFFFSSNYYWLKQYLCLFYLTPCCFKPIWIEPPSFQKPSNSDHPALFTLNLAPLPNVRFFCLLLLFLVTFVLLIVGHLRSNGVSKRSSCDLTPLQTSFSVCLLSISTVSCRIFLYSFLLTVGHLWSSGTLRWKTL